MQTGYFTCTQVLSNSVATALELTGNDDMSETAKFAKIFDKFFDCLNVGSFDSGRNSRNCFKNPYRSATDFRLNVSAINLGDCSHLICTLKLMSMPYIM